MLPPVIHVERLTRRFGGVTAVEDLSFHLERGEVVGFLGPNGAGKTTTMRILTGYLPATSGSVLVAGLDVLRQSLEVRRRIGYLPESVPLYRELRVREMLLFQARLHRMGRAERVRRIPEVLEQVGIAERADALVGHLSRGQRQRVGIAVALLHKPEVLFLDEPTSGLDPLQRPARQSRGDRGHRLLQVHRELLLAKLLHEARLLLDHDELALVDHADAVGHLLGFLDVVRGEDDGGPLVAQLADERPHVAPQLHVHARGGLVEEQHLGLVGERLRDHHAPLHAPRERHDAARALVPERKRAQHLLDVGGIGGEAEQAAAEARRGPRRLEHVGVELLRHEPDARARGAVVGPDVVPGDRHPARRRGDDAADDADERGLPRAVGAEEREDLAAGDVQVHGLQGLVAGSVGLREAGDREDGGRHARHSTPNGAAPRRYSRTEAASASASTRETAASTCESFTSEAIGRRAARSGRIDALCHPRGRLAARNRRQPMSDKRSFSCRNA